MEQRGPHFIIRTIGAANFSSATAASFAEAKESVRLASKHPRASGIVMVEYVTPVAGGVLSYALTLEDLAADVLPSAVTEKLEKR